MNRILEICHCADWLSFAFKVFLSMFIIGAFGMLDIVLMVLCGLFLKR